MISTLEPIKPINIFTYRCDSAFVTDPLKEQLETNEKYGFIIIDGNGTLFAVVQGNAQQTLYKLSVDLPKKHRRGGQSALRFARLRLEARHNYLMKITELATKYYINDQTNKSSIRGLVLAGCGDFKDQLAKALDPRLTGCIIEVVDVSYGFAQGLHQAIELTSNSLKNIALVQQKKLLSAYFEEVQTDSGKICYGIDDTLAALSTGAMETLVVWEDLKITRHVIKNNKTGEETVVFLKEDAQPILKDENNPDEKLEIIDSSPLVDWFAEHFEEFGTQLQLVQDATPEGSQFAKGFGGVGGFLRYKTELPSSLKLSETEENDKDEKQEDKDEDDEEQYWL